MNHYNMLDEYFQQFANNCGINYPVTGLISAHGDKFYFYRKMFEEAGFEFWQGVGIGLLSYINPWAKEVHDTDNGFIKFEDWFAKNKEKFRNKFPPLTEYKIEWTAPDGFFGDEKAYSYKDAQRIKWDYEREYCKVFIYKAEKEIVVEMD